jgi:hypothetical protein
MVMKKEMRIVAVTTLLGLSACQNLGSAPSSQGAQEAISSNPVVSSTVLGAEQTLTLLERAADVYVKLPRCGSGASLCSDSGIVKKIRELDIKAYDAVMAARNNEALAGMAWAAVNAFKAVVPGA